MQKAAAKAQLTQRTRPRVDRSLLESARRGNLRALQRVVPFEVGRDLEEANKFYTEAIQDFEQDFLEGGLESLKMGNRNIFSSLTDSLIDAEIRGELTLQELDAIREGIKNYEKTVMEKIAVTIRRNINV